MNDPVFHSHCADVLPDAHPLAFVAVYCGHCGVMVHAFNNECMQSWFETGRGARCFACFICLTCDPVVPMSSLPMLQTHVVDPQWGLP